MTHDVDTTALRALWPNLDPDLDACTAINALCDALDAARAERDDYKASALEFDKAWAENKARAGAAETRIAELEDRLLTATRSFDKAETRIAAALDVCHPKWNWGRDSRSVRLCEDIRRALTGGTP